MDVERAFAMGGWPMYAILCISGLSHLIALLALVVAVVGKKGKGGAAIALGSGAILFAVVTMALGAVGYFWGMSNTEAAVAFADPSAQEAIRQAGRAESMTNVYFGCCATVFPAIAGVVALLRGLKLRRTIVA